MGFDQIAPLILAVLAISSFISDYRHDRVKWWSWVLLGLSIFIIVGIILCQFFPEVLG